MKHKLGYLLTAGLAMVLTTVGIVSTKALEKPVEPTFATYTNGDGATYYNGIGDSLTGNSLRSALNRLNDDKRHSTVGYSSMGTSPSGQFKYTDYTTDNIQYDSNGQPYGTKIVSFYSGNSTTAFNREHVWPNSHGGNLTENDIHMPRPTIEAENGSRGNSFYVEGMKSGTNGWDPAMESFGDETYRGDSARIIFYCMIAEPNYSLLEADYHSTSNSNKDNMMGRLSHLIKWNINYPVTDRERRRNEGAEYLQGNRNPFIDHPEYACRIWGSTNSTTQQLCANATYPDQAHTAGIRTDDGYTIGSTNTTVYTLKVGDSVNFLPFVDGAFNASVSWTLSDYTTVSSAYYGRSTYTNGLTITGLAEGTSTLTLSYSYTDNNQQKTATATCIITVSNSESGGGESSGDVENETSATYTVSSTSSVTKTGTAPSGSTASYSQTYGTTSQITGGKNAILTLSGYAGKVITGITLNMKSNSSSGSGSLSITAGSTILASLNSTGFNGWYDNNSYGTSYRDVHVTLTNSSYVIGNNEAITIRIDASQNSLYISSYTITYGDPASGGSEEVTLSSITVSGMTQNYIVGDTFSFDGIVTAHYSDGNSETVLPDSVSSPNMSTVGNKTVTVYYSEGGVDESVSYTIYVTAAQKTLTSIAVSTAPTKTTYTAGDYFDPTALVITRNYSDGSDDTYAYAGHTSEFSFTPSTSTALTTSNSSVKITYGGKDCYQSITVNSKTLSAIEITSEPTKTTYYVGDTFSSAGLEVTAHYNNETSSVVTPTSISSPNMSTAGQKEITVSYTESGVTKTAKFNITVTAVTLESISVNGYTTSFTVGDTFSFGGTVTAHYNNGSTSNVTNSATFTGYDMNSSGAQTVTVSYSGQTTTYGITVSSEEGYPYIDVHTGSEEYTLFSGALEEGDYIIYDATDGKAMKNEVTSKPRIDVASVTPSNNKFTNPDASIVWHIAQSGSNWTIYNESVSKYAAFTLSNSAGTLVSDLTDYAKWTVSGSYDFINVGKTSSNYLRHNNGYGFAAYSNSTGHSLTLYKKTSASGGTTTVEITSINATSSVTTYHPGETFDSSKVTVVGTYTLNAQQYQYTLPTEDCLFSPNNYMFTYDDSRTGSKSISVNWEGVTTSISISVTRVDYINPSSVTDSLVVGDTTATGTSYVSFSGVSKSSGAVYAGNNAKGNNVIQLRDSSGSGIWTTSSGGKVKSITVDWYSSTSAGRTLNVYLSNNPYSGVSGSVVGTIVKGTSTTFTVTGDYAYVALKSNSGAMWINNISIEYGTEQSATNVANYIMYEDTSNQCSTKFDIAKGYFTGMSQSERNTFMTSSDYVISTARERFEAWARHEGKTISQVNGDYVVSSQVNNLIHVFNESCTNVILIVVISIVGLSTLGGFFFIKKRKEI